MKNKKIIQLHRYVPPGEAETEQTLLALCEDGSLHAVGAQKDYDLVFVNLKPIFLTQNEFEEFCRTNRKLDTKKNMITMQ